MQGERFLALKSGGLTDSNTSSTTTVLGDLGKPQYFGPFINELLHINDLKRSFHH